MEAVLYTILLVTVAVIGWIAHLNITGKSCLFGHNFQIRGRLLNQCLDCQRWYQTDYFASAERGELVRYEITEQDALQQIEEQKRS